MKILVEPFYKKDIYSNVDGVILALKDFSVQSPITFTMDEIKKIVKLNPSIEVFVSLNKNFFNDEIDNLIKVLKELDKSNIKGVFFYDLAVLEIKKKYNLKLDLVWNQTHMVNNYRTCDYYYTKGVKYALLGKEITLEEIKEIAA